MLSSFRFSYRLFNKNLNVKLNYSDKRKKGSLLYFNSKRSLSDKAIPDTPENILLGSDVKNLISHLREAHRRNNQNYMNRNPTNEEAEVFSMRINESLKERGMGDDLIQSLSYRNKRRMLDIHSKLSSRDLWAVNQFISIYSAEGNLNKAFQLYKRMESIPIKPNEDTFHFLLKGCALDTDVNHVEDMFYLLNEMDKYSLKPNIHTFNLAVEICANASDSKSASRVFEMIQDLGLEPDLNTYNYLILSLKNSSIETIMNFWNQFTILFEPNLVSFYSILVVMNRTGDYSYLKGIIKDLISKNIVPDNKTLRLILDSVYESNDKEYANEVFEKALNEWKDIDFDSEVVYSLVKLASLFSPGHIDLSVNLIRSKNITLDEKFFEIVIASYGKFGNMENTIKYFERAVKTDKLTLKCYYGLLFCCLIKKDADRAWICYQSLLRSKFDITEKFINMMEKVLTECKRKDLLSVLKDDIKKLKG